MKKSLLSLIGILCSSPAIAQTNPCTVPATDLALVSSPAAKLIAQLPSHNTVLLGGTTPLTGGYELRYFFEGATAPFTTVAISKVAFTLVPSTPDCYEATVTWPTPLTPNQRYRAVLIAKATSGLGLADSAASELSNPFGRPAGSPTSPAALQVGPPL